MSAAPTRELFLRLRVRPLESEPADPLSHQPCENTATSEHNSLGCAVRHQVTSFSFPPVRAHACFLWNSKCYLARKRMALLVKPISLQRFNISSPTMKRRPTPSPDDTIIFLLCRRFLMHKVLDMLASTICTKSSIKTRPTNIQCSHSVHRYVERVHHIHDCE